MAGSTSLQPRHALTTWKAAAAWGRYSCSYQRSNASLSPGSATSARTKKSAVNQRTRQIPGIALAVRPDRLGRVPCPRSLVPARVNGQAATVKLEPRSKSAVSQEHDGDRNG